nr:ESPR-type extended signal peptide-containing protein [uncultured Haemophilus sp.]
MNKVFKVIWNHATQSWVAVSELASAKGKTKSKTSTLTALSVVVGSAMVAGSALAAVSTTMTSTTIGQQAGATISGTTTGVFHLANGTTTVVKSDGSATPTNVIVIGNRNDNVFDNQVLIGYNITSIANGKAGDTVVGNRVQLGGGSNGNDSFSTAVGFGTQVAGPSVAIGVGARSDILDSTGWNATSNAGVAIGAFALQGGNINGGTVIGGLSSGDYHYATSIGALSGITNTFVDKATDKSYILQEGGGASNLRVAQTSIGYKAGARGARSVAIGSCATTGVAHTVSGVGAIAIGDQSQSFKDGSIAIGQQAVAGGVTAAEITALNTEVARIQGLLDTANATLATAITNMNADPSADNKFNVASAQAAVQRISLALERAQRDLAKASVNNSTTTTAMAIGYQAHANNLNATAIGRASASYAENSISLGRAAGVTGANATRGMALGDGAAVTGDSAVNSTAIGAGANIRQNSTNAIAFGTNASVVGDLNGSSNSIAIGNQTAAGNRNARWGANSARALGFLAAQNATAVGSESIAGGDNAAAFGYKNVINAPNSTAVGFNNTVGTYSNVNYANNVASASYAGLNTHVIGANNNVTANNTMVFGNNIRVTESNRSGGVVIGDNSSLPTNTTAVNSASVNNITYSGFAGNLGGTSTDGTSEFASDQGRFVSIGNATSPRQLKYVAAGEIGANSTDAINGSQLYLLTSVMGNVGQSVANVIGGNATMYANGTVANFTQPLNVSGLSEDEDYTAPTTDADNVADAITNLNNYVNAGWIVGNNTATKVARISPNEQVNFLNGTATSAVATANGTGADITYNVNVDNTTIAVNGTSNQLTVNTTTLTNNPNGTVVTPVANASNLVNASQVAAAINNSGWNTTLSNGTNVTVNPGDAVNYVSGNGTAANVTVNDAGAVVVSYDVNTTTGTVIANGTATVVDGSAFLNASTVANLVNNAAFNVTTAKNDVFVTNQEGKANATVKAGGNITYTAGKNIAIKQDGSNFTFATEQNVTFTNANVTSTLAIGNASSTSSPVVNIKTENATTANVNNATTSPTAALNITSADGNATQIKGVASSLNTTTVTTFPDGTTDPTDTTTATSKQLLNLGTDDAPLSDSVLNSVVTVRDLTNLGWVVSANGNNYTDTVKNANEVKFNGVNGITVTGNTTNGVRNINISLNTTNITSNANGTSSVTNGDSYVNASTVSDAINKAGWNTTTSDGTNVTVNPGDTVNYVNSSTATANVTVSKDANGKDVVNVTYDVNTGSITAADSNATITVTNDDGTTSTVANPDRGKVTVEDGQGDKVATVQNVADAINSAKWIASVEETNEEIATSTADDAGVGVGAGDELSFKAGKNLKIKRDGQNITYALANDINVTTVTATGNITVGTGDNATTINQGSITNLNDHLTAPTANSTSPVTNATSTTAPTLTNAEKKQAATVNDVLNAGWNLQANDNAVDAVTHGNTVNFVSTDGSVTITPTTDGSTSKLDFSVNATSIVTNAAGNVSANATTGKAVVGANGVANTTTGYANKVATVGDVANTINNTGWLTNVTDANGNVTTKVVTPGTQVNYVNGNGTTANVVANSTTGGLDVTFNVSQNKAGTQNANGTVTLADAANGTSTFLNAQDTVNLINSASFNVTTAKVDSFVTNQEGKENKAVKAGETITYTAGKNIAIKQDSANFTFATEQNVTFTNANVTGTLSVGAGNTTSPVVNITTGTGEHNNNGTTTSPSTVNMGNAQLTNVSAGANVYGQVVDANGRPLTAVTTRDASGNAVTNYYAADQFTASGALIDGATSSTPVTTSNVAKAVSGLADLASSNATNVMTVADAKNLGWVVSTSDNDYADKVQNANQVNFKAEANTGVTVKGATNATTGVREVVVGNDYFKANATAGSTAANAAGSNSVAVGPNSVANTAGSVAIGNGANVTTSAPAGSVAIGQGATAGAVNTGAYRIDGSTDVAGAPNATTRVFSVGNASSPSQIQNVAAGVVSATSTDAVNGSQLHATNQAVINNARAIGHLDHKIDQVDKRGRKGTAIAGAIGMLPQPHISGKSMVSAATTNYRGEQAIAVGYSRLSDNGKHIIKLSGSSNVAGKKDAMVGAAYGYQW